MIFDFFGLDIICIVINIVFVDGNLEVGVMLIGEVLGVEEDRKGFFFVGVVG